MKTIKANVHRLPTEDASRIMMFGGTDLIYTSVNKKGSNRFHLYITTDEEIKEGWFIHGNVVEKLPYALIGHPNRIKDFLAGHNAKKIIATTDLKLIVENAFDNEGNTLPSLLPQIPQSFIEEYCKAGGIDEVLVECKEVVNLNKKGIKDNYTEIKPKLNPDNTIIIHPVEEKMYSREEIGNKIKEFVKEYAYEWDMDDINEWIEENL